MKPATIRTRLAPLILIYETNRKSLAGKLVNRTIPKGNTRSKDRGYTLHEIQKLLSIAKIPNKPDRFYSLLLKHRPLMNYGCNEFIGMHLRQLQTLLRILIIFLMIQRLLSRDTESLFSMASRHLWECYRYCLFGLS